VLEKWTLLIAAGVAFSTGSIYTYVAARLHQRRVTNPLHHRALDYFALWWVGLGVSLIFGSFVYLAAAFGYTSLDVQLVLAHTQRLLLAVSLVGLMHYMIFVRTGRSVVRPLIAFYFAYYIMLLTSLITRQPESVLVGNWRTDLNYVHDSQPLVSLLSLVILVVPPVAGAISYMMLYFKLDPVHDRIQRFRVMTVSVSLIVWWVVAVLAGQQEALGADVFQIFNRIVGFFAALAILMAYSPPGFILSRLEATGMSASALADAEGRPPSSKP
jgi:hypothetical protein